MYKRIEDYGIIGNLRSVALIGSDGSIDWMCLPHIDSPSVFGALLDARRGGRFAIHPVYEFDSVAEYEPDTNILVTRFRTGTGAMRLTDFMPILSEETRKNGVRQELYRRVEIVRGHVDIELLFEPRFDYARADTRLENRADKVVAQGNGAMLMLSATRALYTERDGLRMKWNLAQGEVVWLHLAYGAPEGTPVDAPRAETELQRTREYWRAWLHRNETGRHLNLGPYRPMVERSALVLKLLYYEPSGAMAAAATTSLPEVIGGPRNWDYRYTWVRDTSITLRTLFNLGHLSEIHGYLRWMERLLFAHGPARLQIMYGLCGEEDLPEIELNHLEGYKGSRPVRTGNGAAKQRQLDIYGEIMLAAQRLSDYVGKIDTTLWRFLSGVCDYVVDRWRDQDSGIWEVRDGPHHFVYSKVMCWVALDRGLIIARRYGFPADLDGWERTKKEIHKEVLKRGWHARKQAFVQHYGSDALDASNLLIPLLGFLPFDDPRVGSTVEAIRQELAPEGFVYRYRTQDGLEGDEGTFLLCTFWLIRCLIGLKRSAEAETLLKRVETVASPLGLFAEEYDVRWRQALGNFPQAFTHIGYINSVIALRQAATDDTTTDNRREREDGPRERRSWRRITLNGGEPRVALPANEIAPRLKKAMNLLRGAFFDIKQGRVAYEKMRHSQAYKDYLDICNNLKHMDLEDLQTREERLAFWINLYNVIVIHGVAQLGVRDSVKEVWNFFRRVQYQIGGFTFTPDDIEHGILRGNRRPPYSFFRTFGAVDDRRRFAIQPLEPRIHFTLVCASCSCPPIEFYSAEKLEQEITIAAEAFINSGGCKVDRKSKRVSLSRIFKWYGRDFGATRIDRLKYISRFLSNEDDRTALSTQAEDFRVEFQAYDWRLNRG